MWCRVTQPLKYQNDISTRIQKQSLSSFPFKIHLNLTFHLFLGEEQFYCGKCDSFFASEVDYTVHLSQHAKPAKRKSTEEAPSFGDSHNVLNEAYDMAVASNLPG